MCRSTHRQPVASTKFDILFYHTFTSLHTIGTTVAPRLSDMSSVKLYWRVLTAHDDVNRGLLMMSTFASCIRVVYFDILSPTHLGRRVAQTLLDQALSKARMHVPCVLLTKLQIAITHIGQY